MQLEQCFACDNERGRCFTERPVPAFDSRAAARGAILGGVVAFLLGGPSAMLWGGGISAVLNGLFGDAVDRKLRAL